MGDTSATVVDAQLADSLVDESTPPQFVVVPLDQLDEFDVDWLSKAREIDPELAARLPSEAAVGPIWGFLDMEQNESQPAAPDGERDRCGNSLGPRPYGLDVRFDLGSVLTLDLYREGTLVTKAAKAAKECGCLVGEPRPPSEGAIVARAERWRGSSRGQWPEGGESRACESERRVPS